MTPISSRSFDKRSFTRRSFLTASAAAGSLLALGAGRAARAQAGSVDDLVLETVIGPLKGKDVEKALAHEHLYVDFLGPKDPAYMDVDWQDAIGASINAA